MGTTLVKDDVWTRFDEASALAQDGRWREAIPPFEALLDEELSRDLRAHVLNDLGVAYQSLGDFENAMEKFRAAWEIYERDKNQLGAAIALGNLGTVHRQQREWHDAIGCFERSLLVFENLKVANLAVAKLRVDMGDALAATGKPKAACEQYELALAQQEADGDTRAMALTLHALGTAQRARNRWEDGIAALERSITLFEQLGDTRNLSITLNRLGELHYERRDYPNAIEVYQRDLKIVEQLKDQRAIAQTLNNLALAYVSEKDFEQARVLLKRAIPLWDKLDDEFGMAMALWTRAQLHVEQADLERADKDGERAHAIFIRLDRNDEADAVRKWLASAQRGKRTGLRRYF